MSLVRTDEFSVKVTKMSSRIGVSRTHSLLLYFFPSLNVINYGHIIKSM